jgi:hypothetical protein
MYVCTVCMYALNIHITLLYYQYVYEYCMYVQCMYDASTHVYITHVNIYEHFCIYCVLVFMYVCMYVCMYICMYVYVNNMCMPVSEFVSRAYGEEMRDKLWRRFLCVTITPFGTEVEPDVYCRNATLSSV